MTIYRALKRWWRRRQYRKPGMYVEHLRDFAKIPLPKVIE